MVDSTPQTQIIARPDFINLCGGTIRDGIRDLLANAVDAVDKDFICPVCQLIVYEAEKCSECEHLFCKDCIKSVKKNTSRCPVDRSEPWITNKMSRIERNTLDQIKFNCPQCE